MVFRAGACRPGRAQGTGSNLRFDQADTARLRSGPLRNEVGVLLGDVWFSEPGRVAPVVPKARARTFGSTRLTQPGSEVDLCEMRSEYFSVTYGFQSRGVSPRSCPRHGL